MKIRSIVAFVLVSVLVPSAAMGEDATGDTRRWRTVHFGDDIVGHAASRRTVTDAVIVSEDTLWLRVQQGSATGTLALTLRYEETPEGTPVAFASRVVAGPAETRVQGTIARGIAEVDVIVDGARETRRIPVPSDIRFPEAQRRAMLAAATAPDRIARWRTFDAVDLVVLDVDARVTPTGDAAGTLRVDQVIRGVGPGERTSLVLDASGAVIASEQTLAGLALRQRACTQDCARRDGPTLHVLERLTMRSPFHIPANALRHRLRFVVATRDGAPITLPTTGEQRSGADPRGTAVHVCATCGDEPPTDAATLARALASNLWLRHDDPQLVAMARRAVGSARDPVRRMQRLEAYVRTHMGGRSEVPGYATALQAARSRRGDCSEFAMLLAALGRAQGIPTRLAAGIAYAEQQRGRRAVFAPHMWVQAHIDGRWRSFDAALDGFDAGHIAFALSYGDPREINAGFAQAGDVRVVDAGRVREPLASTAPASTP